MKVIIKIANVYDGLLEETRKELVIVKGNRVYIGKLFFKKEDFEIVRRTKNSVRFEGNAEEIMLKAYEMCKEEGMIAKDDKSLLTMMHWQYMNGLTDEMIDSYKYKSDTEYLKAKGVMV